MRKKNHSKEIHLVMPFIEMMKINFSVSELHRLLSGVKKKFEKWNRMKGETKYYVNNVAEFFSIAYHV